VPLGTAGTLELVGNVALFVAVVAGYAPYLTARNLELMYCFYQCVVPTGQGSVDWHLVHDLLW